MNIFYLSENVSDCAKFHNNKHCVKMILEYSQLLCTAHRFLDEENVISQDLYRLTHVNHPCSKWVRQSAENYIWLYNLLIALHEEYTHRYKREHKSKRLIPYLAELPKNINKTNCFTNPPLAMPDYCKCDNPIEAYRKYYIKEKNHLSEWKNRDAPEWYMVS